MKKIIAAMALGLASTAANAATWTFDIKDVFTGVASGTGSFTFADQTTAVATSFVNGVARYQNGQFTMTLNPTGKPTTVWTQGGVGVAYDAFTQVGPPPVTTIPAPDGLSFVAHDGGMHAYGDFSITSPRTTISNGDFSAANFRALVASMTTARVTLGEYQPNLRMTAFNFVEVAQPVPEPGEWAMIAVGLVIVGGVARRRARLT